MPCRCRPTSLYSSTIYLCQGPPGCPPRASVGPSGPSTALQRVRDAARGAGHRPLPPNVRAQPLPMTSWVIRCTDQSRYPMAGFVCSGCSFIRRPGYTSRFRRDEAVSLACSCTCVFSCTLGHACRMRPTSVRACICARGLRYHSRLQKCMIARTHGIRNKCVNHAHRARAARAFFAVCPASMYTINPRVGCHGTQPLNCKLQ